MQRMTLLMVTALALATAGGCSRKDAGQGVKDEVKAAQEKSR
jgi:hypothetical protein